MTVADEKKQALAVEIDVEKLSDKNGMQTPIRDSVDVTYENHSKFDKYHREEGQDMSSFIIKVERRYDLGKTSDKSLPDVVVKF